MADLSNLDISTLIDRIDMLLDSLKSYDDLNDNEVALMIQSEQIKDWLWIERDVAFARSLAEPNESQEGRSDEFSQRFMSEIHGGSSTTYSPEAIRSTFGKYFGGTPYIRPIFQRPLDSCTSAPRGPGTSHEPISSPNSPTRRRGPLAHPLGSSISAGLILADSSSSKVSNINPSQPRSYTSVSTAAVGLPAPNEASSRPRPRVSHPSTLEDIRMRSWVDLPAPGEPSSSKAAGKRPETNLLSNANIQNAKRIPITITPMRAISASEAPYTFGRPSSATTRSSNNSVAVPELRSSAVERSVASIGVSASADIVTSTPILFGPMASSSARTPIPVIASSSRASISERSEYSLLIISGC
ncbi:hypothetical protein BJ165DRAFT_348908 [Panaeolus papilionaceus]|nr:hypothetical protein BJ165DRAFT_348908 [Panaeolus papilionaceus]